MIGKGNPQPIKVLLIENDKGDADLVRELLLEERAWSFEVEWVSRLEKGLERLRLNEVEVVLLDLGLPDSQGLDTFLRLHDEKPSVPVVILTGSHRDSEVGLEAIKRGAQDYIEKGEGNGRILGRVLRYAIERKRTEKILRTADRQLVDLVAAEKFSNSAFYRWS